MLVVRLMVEHYYYYYINNYKDKIDFDLANPSVYGLSLSINDFLVLGNRNSSIALACCSSGDVILEDLCARVFDRASSLKLFYSGISFRAQN